MLILSGALIISTLAPHKEVQLPVIPPPITVYDGQPTGNTQSGNFDLDDRTEVWLDGKRVSFDSVPKDAIVVGMDVDKKHKKVLIIKFVSKEKNK